jgi:hypothetical protein
MRCWNCGKKIAGGLKTCPYCETPTDEAPTEEEIEAVRDALSQMDEGTMAELQKAMAQAASAEEFANLIMVGPCPKCNSSDTGDCENDPEIDSILVGRCYQCGQLWCVECEQMFAKGQIACTQCEDEDAEE